MYEVWQNYDDTKKLKIDHIILLADEETVFLSKTNENGKPVNYVHKVFGPKKQYMTFKYILYFMPQGLPTCKACEPACYNCYKKKFTQKRNHTEFQNKFRKLLNDLDTNLFLKKIT